MYIVVGCVRTCSAACEVDCSCAMIMPLRVHSKEMGSAAGYAGVGVTDDDTVKVAKTTLVTTYRPALRTVEFVQ